jgi:FkbM family methyltransferase
MIRRIIVKYLNRFCLRRVTNNTELLNELFVNKRDVILKELYTYPSFINSGYLHFEKLFEIATDYNLLNKEGLILDVGGADGVTAIKFHETFKKSKVLVFEPLEENIEVLKRNIQMFDRITLHPIALGSEKKQSEINITKRITSSSLLPINTSEFKDDYMSSQLVPESVKIIEVDTIDNIVDLNQQVSVIKLDVQGYEYEVLKGAVRTLKNTDLIMVELQNHKMYETAPMYYDLDAFLREHNFTLLQNIPSLREKHKQLEWDAIYINNRLM